MGEEERTTRPGGPPAGWYPDPYGSGGLRWWDGGAWTGHQAPAAGQPPAQRTSGFAIASLVFGIIGGGLFAIVFGLVARSQIKKSGGALGGRGLATAGLVLGGAWIALLALIVVLAVTGVFDEEPNAPRFAGERREIAEVVDRFQQALEDERAEAICGEILTPDLAQAIATGSGKSCPGFFADETEDANQVPITIERMSVGDTMAFVVADEGGDTIRLALVRDGAGWRISSLD